MQIISQIVPLWKTFDNSNISLFKAKTKYKKNAVFSIDDKPVIRELPKKEKKNTLSFDELNI